MLDDERAAAVVGAAAERIPTLEERRRDERHAPRRRNYDELERLRAAGTSIVAASRTL